MWTTVGGAFAGSEKTGKTVPLPDESFGASGTDGRCGLVSKKPLAGEARLGTQNLL